MRIPALQLGDDTLQRVEKNIVDALNKVLGLNIDQAVYLDRQDVNTTDTVITHGLGRRVRGVLAIKCYGTAAALCESLTANSTPTQTIVLKASANTTCDLLVW